MLSQIMFSTTQATNVFVTRGEDDDDDAAAAADDDDDDGPIISRKKFITKTRSHLSLVSLLIAVILISQEACDEVHAFRISFGHRLFKSIQQHTNPQLNPPNTLIRPIECRNANNHSEAGICMFSIDCMQNKGVPLSICKHNYFVGTCCKLPDYNNFVGIVYDLRETETGAAAAAAQLEARRASATTKTTTTTTLFANQPTQAASTTTTTSARVSPSTLLSTVELSADSTISPADTKLLDEKYFISSTKLFTTLAPQASSSTQARTIPTTSQAATSDSAVVESARSNSDNSQLVQAHQDRAPSVEFAPELIMMRQNLSLGGVNESSSPLLDESVLSNLSSSNLARQNASAYELLVAASVAPSNNQSGVYLMSGGEESSGGGSTRESLPTTIVFANNHHAPPTPSVVSPTGVSFVGNEQEFTLSTSGASEQPPHTTTTTTLVSTNQQTTRIDAKEPPATVSPFVDLISSSATQQTTTPFTSSLSTAILPQVNSHPYAPTTATPTTTHQAPDLVHHGHENVSLVSPAAAAVSSSVSPSPPPQPLQSSTPFSNAVQFYSTASKDQQQQQQAHSHRPSSLQVASKIVTGNSGTNNLIPGLSGLQSAILSHIPFKLASGLSTGLSSYLQAAMKPQSASATPHRPLISSNTAPALQYQQQQHQHTSVNSSNANRESQPPRVSANAPTTGSHSSGATIRFPSPSSSTSTTESYATSASSSTVSSNLMPAREISRDAQQVCGRPQVGQLGDYLRKRVARIVGGNQSSFGQWPWMVSLRQWRKGAFLHKCGAALLNENWAITAAHCVENVKAPDLLLRLGEFDVSNQNEPFPYVERRVKQVVAHPLFDPKTFEYDLALLRFTEPILYERNILPVCVPTGNDSYVDRMATVIGWGRLFEDGPLPDVIQHVDVPIITNQECEKMYKNAGFVEEIPEMFICAGISKGGRDSCEGDSGGPLTMVDTDGRSYLVGIISWGIGCALPSQPGVYTRITAFSSWINQIINAS